MVMRRQLKVLVVSCCLLMTGCQGFLAWKPGPSSAPPAPPARVKLEFQNLEHDGTFLSGRFLVGVESGSIRLDKRLVENVSVTVESVRACDTHEDIPYIFADYITKPLQPEHVLILEPGYWYGADLRFLLLDEKYTGKQGPPCMEVELSLGSFDDQILARQTFRAWRKGERPTATPATEN
jgi:hypothetical protein